MLKKQALTFVVVLGYCRKKAKAGLKIWNFQGMKKQTEQSTRKKEKEG